jgi:hypothetical protein
MTESNGMMDAAPIGCNSVHPKEAIGIAALGLAMSGNEPRHAEQSLAAESR